MKHFYQETEYTCACATARMLLLEMKGISKSELEIEEEMGTHPVVGSSTQDLMDYLTKYGITCELVTDSSVDVLKEQSSPIVFLYSIYGKIPHASIGAQIDDDCILLFDPSDGISEIQFSEIDDVWFTDENVKSFIKLS